MPLKPLWDNVWGVTVFEKPKHSNVIESPFEEKKHHLLKVVAVGRDCKEVQVGDVVILPEDNGGVVVTLIDNETGELDHVYAVSEKACMMLWYDEYVE